MTMAVVMRVEVAVGNGPSGNTTNCGDLSVCCKKASAVVVTMS